MYFRFWFNSLIIVNLWTSSTSDQSKAPFIFGMNKCIKILILVSYIISFYRSGVVSFLKVCPNFFDHLVTLIIFTYELCYKAIHQVGYCEIWVKSNENVAEIYIEIEQNFYTFLTNSRQYTFEYNLIFEYLILKQVIKYVQSIIAYINSTIKK